MSLIPGNTYEKTIFPDGIQVDHISENTSGHGIVFDKPFVGATYSNGAAIQGPDNWTSMGTVRFTTETRPLNANVHYIIKF